MSRDATALLNDLAEPAAPTGVEEWNRGQGQATLNGPPAAPTVTREQAASVLTIVRQEIALARLECHREGNAKSERFFYEMGQALERSEPAFFRAVADALEEK